MAISNNVEVSETTIDNVESLGITPGITPEDVEDSKMKPKNVKA